MNIRLLDGERLKYAMQMLSETPLDGTKEFLLREYKSARSLEQNSLYWVWLPALSEQTGFTVDELHDKFKRTYMLQIYMAEAVNERQREWISLYDVIKEDGTEYMIDVALQTISTTWANTSQFKEYMDRIEKFCMSKDLHLPAREAIST